MASPAALCFFNKSLSVSLSARVTGVSLLSLLLQEFTSREDREDWVVEFSTALKEGLLLPPKDQVYMLCMQRSVQTLVQQLADDRSLQPQRAWAEALVEVGMNNDCDWSQLV